MAWAKLDDRFYDHRKVKKAWLSTPASVALYVMAITYAAAHETDGAIDLEFVKEKVPSRRDRDRMTTALVDAGLWTETEHGWLIHDYLKYNPSHAKLEEKRVKDAERKALGRSTQSKQRPHGHDADSGGIPGGLPPESERCPVVPTRPVFKTAVVSPSNASGRERAGGNGATNTSTDEELAEHIRGMLANAVDGLMTTEGCKAPTRQAVLIALRRHHPSPAVALDVATEVRSIVQSQDRAPNIVGLYEQKLAQAVVA
jgi:hypothetical protein